MSFSDLLGIAGGSAPPAQAAEEEELPAEPPAQRAPPADPVIAYPSALEARRGAAPRADELEGPRRFVVRSEGRWRVRAAPSLSSRVIGTVASGTVVIGREVAGEVNPTPLLIDGPAVPGSAGSPPGALQVRSDGSPPPTATSVSTLWIRATRFEAADPMGVSDIKRDVASGGALYCLRRNALGYGLYEDGVESVAGPLLLLPDHLSLELRTDAQRAAADKGEDVSLTWKLLGAAESVGDFFSSMWGTAKDPGVGVQEDIRPHARRRPEEVFEIRQREQLKKAASAMKKACHRILEKSPADGRGDDHMAGLPVEVRRRFARLRCSLMDAATSEPLVVSSPPAGGQPPEAAREGASEQAVDGSAGDLERFCELCARLECTGGWPEVGPDLRNEVIAFSSKHAKELEEYARRRGRGRMPSADSGSQGRSPAAAPSPSAAAPAAAGAAPEESLLGDLTVQPQRPSAAGGMGGFLLPPPPPPKNGVQSLI